jgi:hypothetical protein
MSFNLSETSPVGCAYSITMYKRATCLKYKTETPEVGYAYSIMMYKRAFCLKYKN